LRYSESLYTNDHSPLLGRRIRAHRPQPRSEMIKRKRNAGQKESDAAQECTGPIDAKVLEEGLSDEGEGSGED
jgi:hypothetical protein